MAHLLEPSSECLCHVCAAVRAKEGARVRAVLERIQTNFRRSSAVTMGEKAR